MVDNKFIDELSKKVAGAMPPGARELRDDLEKNVRAVLHSSFQKLDLVTREEFDIQSEVLANTRAKLNKLEEQISALEEQIMEEKVSHIEEEKKD